MCIIRAHFGLDVRLHKECSVATEGQGSLNDPKRTVRRLYGVELHRKSRNQGYWVELQPQATPNRHMMAVATSFTLYGSFPYRAHVACPDLGIYFLGEGVVVKMKETLTTFIEYRQHQDQILYAGESATFDHLNELRQRLIRRDTVLSQFSPYSPELYANIEERSADLFREYFLKKTPPGSSMQRLEAYLPTFVKYGRRITRLFSSHHGSSSILSHL